MKVYSCRETAELTASLNDHPCGDSRIGDDYSYRLVLVQSQSLQTVILSGSSGKDFEGSLSQGR